MTSESLLSELSCPVIPVVVIEDIEHAVPLAEALFSGGIAALEITLRTDLGLKAVSKLKAEFPDRSVGAGTVCTSDQFAAAADAGADFIVSPGATQALLSTASNHALPFLPGAVTASEVMRVMELGFSTLKFFPAETSGGAAALRALAGPFPSLRFMPTGGITRENLGDYLRLDNVLAVGGSWLTPRALCQAERWDQIEQLASETVELSRTLQSEVSE
jgi:2-dehydro-3-deoxyphosphogluconate aldolase/(4S)-4-hydroxy-2-oxoglutarate aldolase